MRRLGFLSLGLPDDAFGRNNAAAFLQGLAALGWKEGVSVQIDWRWYGADAALAERQAAELIALRPDVILAGGNPAVEKLRQQTKTIPVVFALVSDPVGLGYVDGLSHPGRQLHRLRELHAAGLYQRAADADPDRAAGGDRSDTLQSANRALCRQHGADDARRSQGDRRDGA